MSEIEKCVCGGEARLGHEGSLQAEYDGGDVKMLSWGYVLCGKCERKGETVEFESEGDRHEHADAKAIKSWNHDQRGLRLLRELVAIRDRALPSGMIYTGKESRELVDLMQRADAWANEGDRE